MTGSERRRQARQKKDAPLILIQRGPREAGEGAILYDVSLGGLAFETSLRMDIGSRFDFALLVPDRGWVDGSGRVCWTKPSGRGWLCGASVTIRHWNQKKLLGRWLNPSSKGLLRFFFPEEGTQPPPDE